MDIPTPVMLWIVSVMLIVMHATLPFLPWEVSGAGFLCAVAGIVMALWEEEKTYD